MKIYKCPRCGDYKSQEIPCSCGCDLQELEAMEELEVIEELKELQKELEEVTHRWLVYADDEESLSLWEYREGLRRDIKFLKEGVLQELTAGLKVQEDQLLDTVPSLAADVEYIVSAIRQFKEDIKEIEAP